MSGLAEFGQYLSRLLRNESVASFGALVAIGLTIASAGVGHGVAIPAWAWAVVSFAALLVAAFLDQRDGQEMEPDHEHWLQGLLANLQASISDGRSCRYHDGVRSEDELRGQIARHFPELAGDLKSWDDLLLEITNTEALTVNAITAEAQTAWGEWRYTVAQYVEGYVRTNLRSADRPTPRFEFYDSGDEGGVILQGLNGNGQVLWESGRGAMSDHQKIGALERVQLLRNWTLQQLDSEGAKQWRESLQRRDALRIALLETIADLRPPQRLNRRRCGALCEAR